MKFSCDKIRMRKRKNFSTGLKRSCSAFQTFAEGLQLRSTELEKITRKNEKLTVLQVKFGRAHFLKLMLKNTEIPENPSKNS